MTLPEIQWLNPATLQAHPSNFKYHPDTQLEALGQSIAKFGWLKTVLWNQGTGRIINGHARVQQALATGELVPVWVVNVTPEQEREMLLVFDEVGNLRERDELALLTLIAQVTDYTGELPVGFTMEHVAALKAQVEAQAGLQAPDPEPKAPKEFKPWSFSLPYTAVATWEDLLGQLQARWGVETASETVLRAIKHGAQEYLGT